MKLFNEWRLELQGLLIFLFGKPRTVVFLLSAQRTGSTLLKALLAQADDVSHLPEIIVSDYGRLGFRLYHAACSLSSARILLIKGPARFGQERDYGDLPWIWRRLGRFVVLYRELEPFLNSVEVAARNANAQYKHVPAKERVAHWMNTYRTLLSRPFLRDSRRCYWVSYETLTRNAIDITQELFRFIGSTRSEGVNEYKKAQGVHWAWGTDDGGERIRSLRVHPHDRIQSFQYLEAQSAAISEAKELYIQMDLVAKKNLSLKIAKLVDFGWTLRSTFSTKRNGPVGRTLALFPSLILEPAWQSNGSLQSSELLAESLAAAYRRRHNCELVFWSPRGSGFFISIYRRYCRILYLFFGRPEYTFSSECALFGRALTRALADREFDVIFSFGPLQSLSHLKTVVPVVAMCETIKPHSKQSGQSSAFLREDHVLLNLITQAGMAHCSKILLPAEAYSEESVTYWKDKFDIQRSEFGANLPRFEVNRVDEASIFGRDRDQLHLLFVDSTREPLEHQIVIQTLTELLRLGLKVQLFLLVENETEVSTESIPNIKRLYFPRQVQEWPNAVGDAFRGAHLLLLPSSCDDAGTSLRVARAFGVPCIATETEGRRRSIAGAETGWLVEGNVESFVKRIQILWADPETLQRAAINALAHSRQCTWDSVAEKLCEVLERSSFSDPQFQRT